MQIPMIDIAAGALLLPAAICDFKRQLIPTWMFLAAAGVDFVYIICSVMSGSRSVSGILLGLLPGMLLLLIALVSEGKAGLGDGLAGMLLGVPIGLEKVFIIITGGLLLMSAAGILLVITKRGGKNTRLPFLPFCLIVYGGLLCAEL